MNNESKQSDKAVMIAAFFVNPYTIVIGLIAAAGLVIASLGAVASLFVGT